MGSSFYYLYSFRGSSLDITWRVFAFDTLTNVLLWLSNLLMLSRMAGRSKKYRFYRNGNTENFYINFLKSCLLLLEMGIAVIVRYVSFTPVVLNTRLNDKLRCMKKMGRWETKKPEKSDAVSDVKRIHGNSVMRVCVDKFYIVATHKAKPPRLQVTPP